MSTVMHKTNFPYTLQAFWYASCYDNSSLKLGNCHHLSWQHCTSQTVKSWPHISIYNWNSKHPLLKLAPLAFHLHNAATLTASGVSMRELFQALCASGGVFIPQGFYGMVWGGCLVWQGGYLWEELNQIISIQAKSSGSVRGQELN